MRVLRFLRPGRSTAAALDAAADDSLGLDAFATEAGPSHATAATSAGAGNRQQMAIIALAALVALQAIPTALWVKSRWAPVAAAAAAAPPAVTASLPPGVAAAAPCDPTATAPPPSGASATGGRGDEGAAPAPVRAAAPALMAGLVSIEAPVAMHVYSGERLVGTTEADTILLPVGTHELELVSEAVGFRARRTVTVQPGRTASIEIDAPRVPVHVNALPWAEVWIDNQRVGETPLGNVQQTIGPHEFVFRHPELGERRLAVFVTMKEPVRVSMDLRKR